jgi:hypothetical protein
LVAERTGADGDALARTSRLVAKVDSAAVQDGCELYLHGFITNRAGEWTVVQQGMLPEQRLARRYHWKSEGLVNFVDDPHAAVEGAPRGSIVNLADARPSRTAQLEVAPCGTGYVLAVLKQENTAAMRIWSCLPITRCAPKTWCCGACRVRWRLRRIAAQRSRTSCSCLVWARAPSKRWRVAGRARCRFSDPARFSWPGGKDGHPSRAARRL